MSGWLEKELAHPEDHKGFLCLCNLWHWQSSEVLFCVSDCHSLPLTNIFASNKAELQMINYCSGGCSAARPSIHVVQSFVESYV